MNENVKDIIGVSIWTVGTSVATVAVEHLVVKPLAKVCKEKFGKKDEEVIEVENEDSTEK